MLAVGLAAFTPEMQAEAERVIASVADEPWHAAAVAALAREEAGDYGTPEEAAEMWNAMVPLYFSRWDERYRPLVEVRPHEPRAAAPVQRGAVRPPARSSAAIDAETLVITGRDDFICGPAAAQMLADGIPRAELVIVEDAGHMLHPRAAGGVQRRRRGFLAR